MFARLSRRLTAVSMMAFVAILMAVPAFAAPPTPAEVVGTAVTDAAASASSIVTAGIPIILGVAVLWVALRFGKRLLAKI